MNEIVYCIYMENIIILLNEISLLIIFLLFLNHIRIFSTATVFSITATNICSFNNCSSKESMHFKIFNVKDRNKIKISDYEYAIEHNSNYHDIVFLIPLYNILIESELAVICKNKDKIIESYLYSFINNYITKNNCIYFNISYLKYLHLHSDIFRLCNYNLVYQKLRNKNISVKINKICNSEKFTFNYSLVTTVYRRNNLKSQLYLFFNQSIPPLHTIVVHDRNIVKVDYNSYIIIYVHTINFPAGFYFRYLMSLLSPENDVIIYDDDWFPLSYHSHKTWIEKFKKKEKKYYSHHRGKIADIIWCATPLIIHRKWLYLMWYNKIFEKKAAEDGHLSFSLLLLCNITCTAESVDGLKYKKDRLSSSNIKKKFWYDYVKDTKEKINSTYIKEIKNYYNIY